jgi:glycosyltransferase involved in cell wall biosynthesis
MNSQSTMRILYLNSSSDLYGSDRSLLRIIQGLDRGLYLPLVGLPYDGPLVGALKNQGVQAFVLPLAALRRSLFTPIGALRFVWDLIAGTVILVRLVRRERVDLIHSNTAAVLVGGVVARLTGIPHIWHVREIILRPPLVRRLIAFCVSRFSDAVIAVSTSVVDNLAKDAPGVRAISRVIHNGIAVSAFAAGDRERGRNELGIPTTDIVVGMIGRVGSWKGQELFLQAARGVLTRIPDARFVAVGGVFKGNESRMEYFKNAVKEAGISERFAVVDFHDDVRDLLAAFDIFVLPSTLPDPFPTTVLEAMAAGKPIVANAHGGVTEMIEDRRSGFLVPPNDVSAMIDRIMILIQDTGLRVKMGQAARLCVAERFQEARYQSDIADVYKGFSQRQIEYRQ